MKKAYAVVSLLCLYIICVSGSQVFSQRTVQANLQIPTIPDSEKPIARLIRRVKDDGELFPVVNLFGSRASSVSEMTTAAATKTALKASERAALQKALKEGVILS